MFTKEEEDKINECVKTNFFSQSFFSDVAGCLRSSGFSQEKAVQAIKKLLNDKKNAYEWAEVWERVSNGEDPNKVLDEYFSGKQKKKTQAKNSPQRKDPLKWNKKKK